jgi:hypothetical protein
MTLDRRSEVVDCPRPMRLRTLSLWLGLALVAIVPSARATTLSPTSAPLPGSTFQAADGDHRAPSGLTDWATEEAAGRVAHAPDPNADDSAFTDGSKENAPGGWGLTTEAGGVDPAKANIRDAWGHAPAAGQPDRSESRVRARDG